MRAARSWIGLTTAALLAAPLWLWAACGSDADEIGGPCRDDRDCAPESRCFQGGDFPEGQCSYTCRDSRECPRDTICVDKSGGYCAWLCREDRDCRPGYECKFEDERGASGELKVCRR
jgi:hypothetical protein